MTIAEDISKEQSNIEVLKAQGRNLVTPRKSINFQFRNLKYGNRNQTQRIVIRKRKRQRINKRISSARNRLISLRELLLPPPSLEENEN